MLPIKMILGYMASQDEDEYKKILHENAYLREEARILRAHLGQRIRITDAERATLLRFAEPLGVHIRHIVNIVHPDTMMRWIRNHTEGGIIDRTKGRNQGRPKLSERLVELVRRFAHENITWGKKRIHGEMMKLGLEISPSSIYNIMKENGLEPAPERGRANWRQFIDRQFDSLIACDFFTVNSWTLLGPRQLYCLVFMHVASRKIWFTPSTYHPNEEWILEQARAYILHLRKRGIQPKYLVLDQDRKYSKKFKERFKASGIQPKFISRGAPKMNAYCESLIRSIRRECTDHFVVIGERHCDWLLGEYKRYFNQYRPHRGLGNVPIDVAYRGPEQQDSSNGCQVKSISFLCGLHHHYIRTESTDELLEDRLAA